MDTKLRNNNKYKITGVLISTLLIVTIVCGILLTYQPVYTHSKNILKDIVKKKEMTRELYKDDYTRDFIYDLYKANYALYMEAKNLGSYGHRLPSTHLLPNYNNTELVFDEWGNAADEFSFLDSFNSVLFSWVDNFYSRTINMHRLEYYVIDHGTGNTLTNSKNSLELLAENTLEAEDLKEGYPFYMVFKYSEDGTVEVLSLSGIEDDWIREFKGLYRNNELIRGEIIGSYGSYDSDWAQINSNLVPPSNATFVYASSFENFLYGENTNLYYNDQLDAFHFGGFVYVFLISLLSVLLIALLLPCVKSLELGKGFASKIPLEINFFGVILPLISYQLLLQLALDTAGETYLEGTQLFVAFPFDSRILVYGINFLSWFVILSLWFLACLSLRQIFTMRFTVYLKEKSITGKVFCYVIRKIKNIFKTLKEVDLTDSSNKHIIKILMINFIIVFLLCLTWVLGILGLIIYTFILFFVFRKYYNDIRNKYNILLAAIQRIADGKLELSIEENLGVFNPLKEELTKVQYGFKKAVDEELKSQNMKTELISNVSHDLKTPLTSIITYVDLLKDENITEEEKKSYIDILDQKSQRLKRLIEDLFEVSKANSNSITLNLVEVDLISLIKQVLLELDDKVVQSEIEFRLNMPTEKVCLNLDSEKTYRIFENLIINVTKYAMPHTRAYIDMVVSEESVTTTIKNISAEELEFNSNDISERFVRGDKARNTEGSGLGLAIVKSFVELQGGSFNLLLDGDLFKTVIKWKK